jgi:hypothetical protein
MTSRARVVICWFGSAAVVLVAAHAHAKTIFVGASCSVQNAVKAANNNSFSGTSCTGNATAFDASTILPGGTGDIVQLESGTHNYSVGSPGLEIFTRIQIQGTSMSASTITVSSNAGPSGTHGITLADCNNAPSGFYVASPDASAQLALSNLTVQQASGQLMAGICSDKGTTNLYSTRVTGFKQGGILAYAADPSDASFAGNIGLKGSLVDLNQSPVNGAGILCYSYGCTLTMESSSVVNNFSEGGGGGVAIQPQVAPGGSTATNSTISGNTAIGNGGGLLLYPAQGYMYMNLTNTTIANNHATIYGGGIFYSWVICPYPFGVVQVNVYQSIVNNNLADSDPQQDNLSLKPESCLNNELQDNCVDSLLYLSGPDWTANQLPSNSGCNFNVPDAKLATLAGQGGPNNLPVHALLAGSAAADAITSGVSPDQRGVARPQFGGVNATKWDMGAVEMVFRMETENLTVAAKKSGVAHAVVSGASYSNGQGTNLQANATNWSAPNAFVTYQTPSQIASGTYNVTVGFKKGSNEGIFQFATAETLAGTYTNVGIAQDSYGTTNTWTSVSLGNVTFPTTGTKFLRFTVTNKNASSGSYQLFPDFVTLTRQ